MRPFSILAIAAMLVGCSPQWHLRQAAAKDPELLKPTTVTVRVDTIIEPLFLAEEVVTTQRDTIMIYKDGAKAQIIRQFDTLRVEVECPGDTIVITKTIECPPQAIIEPLGFRWRWWHWIVLALFGWGAIFVIRNM